MKQVYHLLKNSSLLVLLFSLSTQAQITIESGDMPSINDTFRLSTQRIQQGQSVNLNLTATGPNSVWNYTSLSSDTQKLDTFFSPLETPIAYNFVFTNLLLYPDNYANLAQRSNTIPTPPTGGGGGGGGMQFNFSDAYDFINNSSSKYSIVGNAFKLNDVPSANAFDGNDVVYEFPLNYQNEFSSNSRYEIHIPAFVDYYHRQTRTTVVDGWGMVYTPYGGFEAIRVKSTIAGVDSIILSAIPFPFATPSTIVEYKWLAKNIGEPVLEINTRTTQGGFGGGGGGTSISKIAYLDSLPHGNFIFDNTAIGEKENLGFEVYPNPTNDMTYLRLIGNTKSTEAVIREISGKELFRVTIGTTVTRLNLSSLAAGIYLVQIGEKVSKIVKL